MATETFETAAFARCGGCQGLWIGAQELQALRQMKGADTIDTGSHADGQRLNAKDDIDCPQCEVRLAKRVDVDQHHIWYEQCPQCQGVFLDAGEFRDLKDYNLVCYLRGLFAKERS